MDLKGASQRNLIFVGGKGGVGKTLVSHALARGIARTRPSLRVLWVQVESPLRAPGEIVPEDGFRNLGTLNCEATTAFEEYASLKIGVPALTRIFVKNAFVSYLAKAAPGIPELLLLGKIWAERERYDRVVVDMPSTGYGLAMFQATRNFSQLFSGGPFHRDALHMLETFGDPARTAQVLVSLPEEMPMVETLELKRFLLDLFPGNEPALVLNRVWPRIAEAEKQVGSDPSAWTTPLARTVAEYALKRSVVERKNRALWPDLEPFEIPAFAGEHSEALRRTEAHLETLLRPE